MKKAKALISYYNCESGFKVHRVYLEPHLKQAENDLNMINEIESLGKELILVECEVFEPIEKSE